jgi:hypothetical protein
MTHHTPATIHNQTAYSIPFKDVIQGRTFECNGNLWTKVSSRTATGIWPSCLPNVQYFRGADVVNVQQESNQ